MIMLLIDSGIFLQILCCVILSAINYNDQFQYQYNLITLKEFVYE